MDNVSAIAAARDKLLIDMQDEWYETITKNFLDFCNAQAPGVSGRQADGVTSGLRSSSDQFQTLQM